MRLMGARKIIAVLLTASKKLNVNRYSNVYEMIWFKLGMTDTTEVYILIQV